jgi:hypothetical protein
MKVSNAYWVTLAADVRHNYKTPFFFCSPILSIFIYMYVYYIYSLQLAFPEMSRTCAHTAPTEIFNNDGFFFCRTMVPTTFEIVEQQAK